MNLINFLILKIITALSIQTWLVKFSFSLIDLDNKLPIEIVNSLNFFLLLLSLFLIILFALRIISIDFHITNFEMFTNCYLLPEYFLINSILLLFLFGIFYRKKFVNDPYYFNFFILVSKSVVLFTAVLVFLNFNGFNLFIKYIFKINNKLFFWDQYSLDFFSLVFKILILVLFYFLLTLLRSYAAQQRLYLFEYIMLGFTALLGGFLMISSFDFLFFYLVLELQALSFYVLAALNVKSKFSAEAGVKYFVTGALASGFLLLGVGFLYGYTGTVNFYQLNLFFLMAENIVPVQVLIFSSILLLAALLIKLGVAPFHMWVPDVYQGSPMIVTALFATLPKISLFPVFLKFLYYILGAKLIGFYNSSLNVYNFIFIGYYNGFISKILLMVGFLSILVGSFGALGQTNIKRFFAYSSIGNIGYTVLVLGINNAMGFQASLFYLFIYLILSINFFAILFALRFTSKISIVDLKDLARINSPYLFFLFSLNLFSLAGVPPLAGFFSKFYVYYALFSEQYYFLTFCLALLTIVSTFYYIRIVAIIFFYMKQDNKIRLNFTNTSIISNNNNFSIAVNQYLPTDLAILIFLTSFFNVFIFLELETFLLFLTKLILLFF
jgi:NADH-quinone oxidoreductase subunit N